MMKVAGLQIIGVEDHDLCLVLVCKLVVIGYGDYYEFMKGKGLDVEKLRWVLVMWWARCCLR